MFSNRLAFAALGLGCVAAAAGGGYLATRQNATVTPVAESALATPAQPVQETEAVVGDSPKAPSAASTGAAAPAAPAARRPDAGDRPTHAAKPAQTTARNTPKTPALERSWPSSTGSQAPAATPNETSEPVPHSDEHPAAEPARAPEPPQKTFQELVISSGSVIGLQTETALSSERAKVEDRVEAHVVRDVRVGSDVAVPAGTRALGSVMVVERGGKFKERARLGIRFNTLVLADGTRLPITTDTIYRDGDAPGNSSAAKIGGGAVAGAILGAIIGGGKGAAVGATAGAGAGTTAVVAGDRSAATFPAGAEVTARMLSPVTVTLEK